MPHKTNTSGRLTTLELDEKLSHTCQYNETSISSRAIFFLSSPVFVLATSAINKWSSQSRTYASRSFFIILYYILFHLILKYQRDESRFFFFNNTEIITKTRKQNANGTTIDNFYSSALSSNYRYIILPAAKSNRFSTSSGNCQMNILGSVNCKYNRNVRPILKFRCAPSIQLKIRLWSRICYCTTADFYTFVGN